MTRHDPEHAAPDAPRVEAYSLPTDPNTSDANRSIAVLLCPFRLCSWHSDDARDLGAAGQDAAVRWHLLDEHRDDLATLAGLHGAPAGVCARPHPAGGRWCLDPRGHSGSHGDGRADRWVQR